jgi:hypothetical protein
MDAAEMIAELKRSTKTDSNVRAQNYLRKVPI